MFNKMTSKLITGLVVGVALFGGKVVWAGVNNKQCNTTGKMCEFPCTAFKEKDALGNVTRTTGVKSEAKWNGASIYHCSDETVSGKNCCIKDIICGHSYLYEFAGDMDAPDICNLRPFFDEDDGPQSTCYIPEGGKLADGTPCD